MKRPELLPNRPYLAAVIRALVVTGLGICVAILALKLTSTAYAPLWWLPIFDGYMANPALLFWNVLPCVWLIWLGYLLTGRVWAGYLITLVPALGLALGNYYKLALRGDPVMAVDLTLLSEAAGISGQYTLELTPAVLVTIACALLGLLPALFCSLLPKGKAKFWVRGLIALAVALIWIPTMVYGYLSPKTYASVENTEHFNPWSEVEQYIAKGIYLPFLHSVADVFPSPPEGYDKGEAAALLEGYTDAPIPEGERVNVVGVMLEAFADFTQFEALSTNENVAAVYAPWHQMQAESLSGNLITNIFAGGTVDSEWTFLTGSSDYFPFRHTTESYVWYFRDQGYYAAGSHPGESWFYNRRNVNDYLGFQDYWFSENHYGEMVDFISAQWNSDHLLVDEIVKQVEETNAAGQPIFSFSVSLQNHGPYEGTSSKNPILTPDDGYSEETCHIVNNYLTTLSDTVSAMVELQAQLSELDEPTVLVLFGDHKPWLGNNNSAYTELGQTFDRATDEGFYSYYSTPYLIWANESAKAVLEGDFQGDGGDISPNFLMNKLFEACDWTGPDFMQFSDTVMAVTPITHRTGRYWWEGGFVTELPADQQAVVDGYLNAQFYRQQNSVPSGTK